MTIDEIKWKFEFYLNAEIEDFKRSFADKYAINKLFSVDNKCLIVDKLRINSIRCMLGATQFVQFLGVSYKDADEIFVKYKKQLDDFCKQYQEK